MLFEFNSATIALAALVASLGVEAKIVPVQAKMCPKGVQLGGEERPLTVMGLVGTNPGWTEEPVSDWFRRQKHRQAELSRYDS